MKHEQFLLGQRLIYCKTEIVTAIPRPPGSHDAPWGYQWVQQFNGVAICVSKSNLDPLPGGQL